MRRRAICRNSKCKAFNQDNSSTLCHDSKTSFVYQLHYRPLFALDVRQSCRSLACEFCCSTRGAEVGAMVMLQSVAVGSRMQSRTLSSGSGATLIAVSDFTGFRRGYHCTAAIEAASGCPLHLEAHSVTLSANLVSLLLQSLSTWQLRACKRPI